MVSNITSSIIDRASVNAKTLKVLQQRWGTTITLTYCHLHPLETLSRNALSCLKAFDTVTYDKLYAGTSMADKLLLAIDKWRYSDSSGEPKTFLSFMKSRDISRGTWARTRGNRLHVKLRNAEVCVKYNTELKCYFTHHTTRESVFKTTILEALSTDVATQQMTALAISSLILSRPWMKKLYIAHGTELTHVGAFKKVKTVISNLKLFTKERATFTIKDIDCDLFGEKLEKNIMGGDIEDGDIWLTGPNTIPVSEMLFRILQGAMSDLQHQYESYLSQSDEDLVELEEATVNTPVHDIAAEQEVGMVSAAKRRAPGATMIFLASTIKSTRNHTLNYLETLELRGSKETHQISYKIRKTNKRTCKGKGGRHQGGNCKTDRGEEGGDCTERKATNSEAPPERAEKPRTQAGQSGEGRGMEDPAGG